MKLRISPVLVLAACLMVVGLIAFAAACAGTEETTTTMAPTATTAAVESTSTTAASTEATSGTVVVRGMVDNPVSLTVADLNKMTVVQITATHPKLGEQQYSGVRFSELLTLFKVQSGATVVDLGCADGYMAEIALADIQKTPDALLAIGDDGTLNAVMPDMSGKAWAKDVVSMEFK
jgi:DMSO/TMAO reductase YedYZ molybdopterin-dependent catalytic subunit